MLSYREALNQLLQAVTPPAATERVPLTDAAGRVLMSDLVAPHPMPPFHQSLMDGYAVRSIDTKKATAAHPVRLKLSSTLTAGATLQRPLAPGEAIRIMTGAPIPAGADCVIRLEDGHVQAQMLVVHQPVSRGRHIQRRGAEVRQRTVIVRRGEQLTPHRIGMAMALGLADAEVVKPPRIALVAPGDELLPPGAALEPGKKWCSNLYALLARAQALGCVSTNLGIVSDTPEALTEALRQGLSQDVVVILGASGRGAHDFAGQAMANIGAEPLFRGVAIAPGRSMAVAQQQRTLIFGLPGSPWASFITFEAMVRPLLLALLMQRPQPPVPAILTRAVEVRPGTTHLLPVRLQQGQTGWEATPLRTLLSVAQAESDAFGVLVVPPHRRFLPLNSRVRIQPL